jgi:cytochrome c553
MVKKILIVTLSLMVAPYALATAPAKAPLCAACHGANGQSMIPGYPNLAGQNAQYLESALKAYRAKQRQGGLAAVMQAQAMMLSDPEIKELSLYFSQM